VTKLANGSRISSETKNKWWQDIHAYCAQINTNQEGISDEHRSMRPWLITRDSHFAKFAIPRAIWAMTSLCPVRNIPSNALIPPSCFSMKCNFSAKYTKIGYVFSNDASYAMPLYETLTAFISSILRMLLFELSSKQGNKSYWFFIYFARRYLIIDSNKLE
jgi:hypothetical protein